MTAHLSRTVRTIALAAVLALAATLLASPPAHAEIGTPLDGVADELASEIDQRRQAEGYEPWRRTGDLRDVGTAWARHLAGMGLFVSNPDLERQVCCDEDRDDPPEDRDAGFFIMSVVESLQATEVGPGERPADAARRLSERFLDRHTPSEDTTEGTVAFAVDDDGGYVTLTVLSRSNVDDFGVPPDGWPRPELLPADQSCPDEPDHDFPDVPADSPHGAAIGCVSDRGIAQGATDGTYRPRGNVTRDQMASFLVRLLDEAGVDLPDAPSSPTFDDIAGSPHAEAIERLAAAGVVAGVGDRRYAPRRIVQRGQMATFLVRAFEQAGGSADLDPAHYDYFIDDWRRAGGEPGPGAVHGAAVQRAAEIGVTGGSADLGFFRLGGDVRRDQMASFLSRLLAAIDAQ
jgi:hypothetical protein